MGGAGGKLFAGRGQREAKTAPETHSIYERKYLGGSDQYVVFLNFNQAQTAIEGSGRCGKLLLIKDSC